MSLSSYQMATTTFTAMLLNHNSTDEPILSTSAASVAASIEVKDLARIFVLDALIKRSSKTRAFVYLQAEHERHKAKQALAFRLLLALFAFTLLVNFLQWFGYIVAQACQRLSRLRVSLLGLVGNNETH